MPLISKSHPDYYSTCWFVNNFLPQLLNLSNNGHVVRRWSLKAPSVKWADHLVTTTSPSLPLSITRRHGRNRVSFLSFSSEIRRRKRGSKCTNMVKCRIVIECSDMVHILVDSCLFLALRFLRMDLNFFSSHGLLSSSACVSALPFPTKMTFIPTDTAPVNPRHSEC